LKTWKFTKLQNMQKYGANVVLCEPTQKGRHDTMMAEAEKMGGATVVHPYDTLTVIAGQGTIGLELLQQVPSLDAILVPTSGGGMVTGIAVAATAIKPGIRVIAVEPRGKRLAGT
jgi:serine racemase